MKQENLSKGEFDKLVELLLLSEGYTTESGSEIDLQKVSKKSFTRTQIILHSIAIFTQKGVTETTVQDLLEAAQVSRRTFYKYFNDKFDVLQKIYTLSVSMLAKRFNDEMSQTSSLTELISKTVDIYFSYHITMGSLIRIMHEEACRQESPLNSNRIADRTGFSGSFNQQVNRYQKKELSKLNLYSVFWILENASLYLLTETECNESDVDSCKTEMREVIMAIVSKA